MAYYKAIARGAKPSVIERIDKYKKLADYYDRQKENAKEHKDFYLNKTQELNADTYL